MHVYPALINCMGALQSREREGQEFKRCMMQKEYNFIVLVYDYIFNFISGFTSCFQSSGLYRVACVCVEMPNSSGKESVLRVYFQRFLPFCFFSFSSVILKEGTVSVTKLGGTIRMT